MNLIDDERIGNQDKVIVVITNQYMLLQTLWYHSKYPEGIWEAVIILFNKNNKQLLDIMYQRCKECGIFSKIYVYGHRNNTFQDIRLFFNYTFQFLTRKRDEYDKNLVKKITGKCDYAKIIIHARNNRIAVAFVNAMCDKVCICMEDGLSDYVSEIGILGIRRIPEIMAYVLSKMNVVGIQYDHQFRLKYDDRIIKYCSIPNKMQYRNYKKIKQLFEENDSEKTALKKEPNDSSKEYYDLLIFSAPFIEDFEMAQVYDILHEYLKENYKGKKILVKPHPREVFRFPWDDFDITVEGLELSGEEILDIYPEAELLFLSVSTILLKVYRDNRTFKVAQFSSSKSKEYLAHVATCSNLLDIESEKWILL